MARPTAPRANATTGRTVSAGQTLKLPSVEHNGQPYNLVFSSLARLQAFIDKPQNYVAMKGRDLFTNTKGAYFMLNPGSDFGKELLPGEIAHLLDPSPTRRAVTIEKETHVLIGQPKEQPWALMEALSEMFGRHPEVAAAYVAQIVYPDEADKPHPLLGVEVEGEWDPVSNEIGRVIDGLHLGLIVDSVPIERGKHLSDSLLQYPPFYRRAPRAA